MSRKRKAGEIEIVSSSETQGSISDNDARVNKNRDIKLKKKEKRKRAIERAKGGSSPDQAAQSASTLTATEKIVVPSQTKEAEPAAKKNRVNSVDSAVGRHSVELKEPRKQSKSNDANFRPVPSLSKKAKKEETSSQSESAKKKKSKKKKPKKHRPGKPTKRSRDFENALDEYICSWEQRESQPWKFDKNLQEWALQNMLDADLISDDLFMRLQPYIATVQGAARVRFMDRIKNKIESGEEDVARTRALTLQSLSL